MPYAILSFHSLFVSYIFPFLYTIGFALLTCTNKINSVTKLADCKKTTFEERALLLTIYNGPQLFLFVFQCVFFQLPMHRAVKFGMLDRVLLEYSKARMLIHWSNLVLRWSENLSTIPKKGSHVDECSR